MENTPQHPSEPPPIITPEYSPNAQIADAANADAERNYELYDALEQTKKIPTRFANRMYVMPDGDAVRVSFGERIADENVYHTALMVPASEAIEMAKLLFGTAQANLDRQIQHLRELADALEATSQGTEDRNG